MQRANQAHAFASRNQLSQAAGTLGPVMPHAMHLINVVELFASIRAGQSQHVEAVELYKHVLKAEHHNTRARHRLAICLRRAGRVEDAMAQINRLRETDPWNISYAVTLADAHEVLGQHEEAAAMLRDVEANRDLSECTPEEQARVLTMWLILEPTEERAEQAASMARDKTDLHPEIRSSLFTRVGGFFQKRASKNGNAPGDVDRAFGAFGEAKTARRLAFEPAAHSKRVGGLVQFWTSAAARSLPKTDRDGSGFVFIVGMPRSGTSLLEQMLGRLPGVAPLGERAGIVRLVGGLNFPGGQHLEPMLDRVGLYSEANLAEVMPKIMAEYEQAAEEYDPDPAGRRVLVDKQCFNFYHLPVIARVLPGAKVIHIRRNPCDTALSCFSQWFNNQYHFVKDMHTLGSYYREYRRAIEAFRKLPAPDERPEMIDVRYEDLVTDPGGSIRPVLEFLGLPWDDRVLAPEQAERIVMTASRHQVKKSINTSAVQRWRPYAEHMQPFLDAIGPDLAAEAGVEPTGSRPA